MKDKLFVARVVQASAAVITVFTEVLLFQFGNLHIL